MKRHRSALTQLPFNAESCSTETANVESWADNNHLKLNRIKSAEIVLSGQEVEWQC